MAGSSFKKTHYFGGREAQKFHSEFNSPFFYVMWDHNEKKRALFALTFALQRAIFNKQAMIMTSNTVLTALIQTIWRILLQ